MKLTIPEEILLLMLDDRTGRLIERTMPAADLTIATAALMELALAGRVDTDPQRLFVTDPTPTGDDVLDPVLEKLKAQPDPSLGSRYWVETLAADAPEMRERLLARLVRHGILREQEGRFLWVFPERRYPTVDDKQEREVKARLLSVLFGDEIPEPRDALMIGLARAIDLFSSLLSPEEAERAEPRIARIADLEELNRSLSRTLAEFHAMLVAQIGHF